MAVKRGLIYQKEINGNWKDKEDKSKKDTEYLEFKRELCNKFDFDYSGENIPEENRRRFGFDGKIHYEFYFRSDHSSDSEHENYNQIIQVVVKKMGAENEIDNWSDLEKYLIANKFSELK